ncbi:MAG TPA: sulfur transferase domain-containing protein, partial [Pyrinomonadaceae bacterium]|nr:sulfur transferase domain-containing protein [Pyrinomonadaceae bacterium]
MSNAKRGIVAAAAVLVLILTSYFLSHASVGSEDLPNFFRVNDKLARGGQPKDAGFAELKKQGFATVISLRDDDERARREKEIAEAAGLRFINMPLANWSRPSIKDIEAIESAIDLPENQPVFVHCRRGADRTGTVMAVYRIKRDGWNAKQASEEAEKFGI